MGISCHGSQHRRHHIAFLREGYSAPTLFSSLLFSHLITQIRRLADSAVRLFTAPKGLKGSQKPLKRSRNRMLFRCGK